MGPRPYRIALYPVAMIERMVLADARAVTVRPVLPQDAEHLQAFVERLSPATRHRRFHHALRALPEPVLRAFTEIDYTDHLGLLAETFDASGTQTVVADARLVRHADSAVAEAAIVVADDWQGVGLGARLTRKLLVSARATGIARVDADVLADNVAMLRVLESLGFRIRSHPDDSRALRATLRIVPADAPGAGVVAAGRAGSGRDAHLAA